MKNTSSVLAAVLALAPFVLQAQSPAEAARVALVTGSVKVGARALSAGDPVYERQVIVVGPNSYANLKFADGGRVLLRPNTEFVVESFRMAAAAPAAGPRPAAAPPPAREGNAFFRLVRGGFRAISGLIGTVDRQAYRVTTPSATIGIRGTDYEVQLCTTDCPTAPARAAAGGTLVAATDLAGLELAQAGGGAATGGVIVATNEGSILLTTSRGQITIDAGQVALALGNGEFFRLPAVPDALLLNSTPPPQECE